MSDLLRRFWDWCARRWQLAREEIGVRIPLSIRWNAWRHGFLGRAGVLYDWQQHGWSAYLPDTVRYLRTPLINGPWGEVVRHKFMFGLLLDKLHPGVTPVVHGMVARGRFLSYPASDVTLDQELRRRGKLILKPEAGGGGVGIVRLEWRDDRAWWNGQSLNSTEELSRRLAKIHEGIVTECLASAAYARAIEPSGAHTLRVLTLWDEAGPFVAAAAHRFATRASAPTDNWARGGLSASVNLHTGQLGAGVRFDPRAGRKEIHARHPDTGNAIAGATIPGWPELLAMLLDLARGLPWLPYLGWDVLVTDDGPRILEANSYTGVTLFQVHGPLLADPRVRSFYEKHCPGFSGVN